MSIFLAILGGLAVASLIFAGTYLFLSRNLQPTQTPPQPALVDLKAISELEFRVEGMERRWNGLLEELDDRIDRGNKAWRRVRARERREEVDAEEEEWGSDVPGGHATRGNGQGMFALPSGLEGESSGASDWEEKKRLVNRALAGFE